jgi:predicted metal-binding membrane protein
LPQPEQSRRLRGEGDVASPIVAAYAARMPQDSAPPQAKSRPLLARMLAHDRALTLATLALALALAWAYLAAMAAGMGDFASGMDGLIGYPALYLWDLRVFLLTLAMWATMMAGMMLPGAAPTLLLFATLATRQRADGHAAPSALVFAAGYLLAWAAFSVACVFAQWALQDLFAAQILSRRAGVLLGGAVFALAGLYQFSPLKRRCLAHCRSPLEFLAGRWPRSAGAALALGAHHGVYCIGCCWPAMALLFVGGVMNFLWAAALAVLVLAEKAAPRGEWIARGAGVAFVAAGAWLSLA